MPEFSLAPEYCFSTCLINANYAIIYLHIPRPAVLCTMLKGRAYQCDHFPPRQHYCALCIETYTFTLHALSYPCFSSLWRTQHAINIVSASSTFPLFSLHPFLCTCQHGGDQLRKHSWSMRESLGLVDEGWIGDLKIQCISQLRYAMLYEEVIW